MPFDFLARVAKLTAPNLTIREQTRLAENPNDLRWRGIAPRQTSPSVKLSELSAPDFRPLGGRREWNAQGREIPEVLGDAINAKMVPINPTHHIDEERLQTLRERGQGVAELINRGIIKDVDEWATSLADAADRQIEFDLFQAWFFGEIRVKDTKSDAEYSASLNINADRYVQAAQTLGNASNAWDDFVGYAEDAQAKMGSLRAVRLRRARMNEILRDAPASQGDRATVASVRQRLADNGFGTFDFIVDERTYDDFDDGGSAYTQKHYVPPSRMAFQPEGGRVATTHFAPVTRADDYMDRSDVETINDFVVFRRDKNDGKTLMVEAQANALPLPIAQYVYVVSGLA